MMNNIRYLGWLVSFLKEIQNMDQFSGEFYQFGISRLFWIEDTKIKVADLNGYRPRLLGIIWFYGKIK